MTKRIAMLVAVVMLGACGAEEPAPTCDPREVGAFGTASPWRDLAVATCGELLTVEQQNERCADGGEYFVTECPYEMPGLPGIRYSFPATCGSDVPACDGRPFSADGSDIGIGVTPVCVDVCPNIR